MGALAFAAILILAGAYFGLRNLRLLRSDDALRKYIETSPKARAWVSKYGVEESMKMARKATIPLGLAVSLAMIGLGAWDLIRSLPLLIQ